MLGGRADERTSSGRAADASGGVAAAERAVGKRLGAVMMVHVVHSRSQRNRCT